MNHEMNGDCQLVNNLQGQGVMSDTYDLQREGQETKKCFRHILDHVDKQKGKERVDAQI